MYLSGYDHSSWTHQNDKFERLSLLMTCAFCRLPVASHGFCHASATVTYQRICRSSLYERSTPDRHGWPPLVTPLVNPLVTSLGKLPSEYSVLPAQKQSCLRSVASLRAEASFFCEHEMHIAAAAAAAAKPQASVLLGAIARSALVWPLA